MNKKDYRNFGYLMAAFIGLFFGLLFPWLFSWQFLLAPWILSLLLLLLALLAPNSLAPLYKLWMAIGNTLGFINTRIILGLVFFVIFTPVAIFLKLLKKDAMKRNAYKQSCPSYWQKCSHKKKDTMENIY